MFQKSPCQLVAGANQILSMKTSVAPWAVSLRLAPSAASVESWELKTTALRFRPSRPK